MSFAVTMQDGLPCMAFKSGNDLLTNMILSLEIAQGSFFADPTFGLRPRPQAKRTQKMVRLIKGDIEDALQWLLDTGRASSIEVTMEIPTNDLYRVTALVEATAPNGGQIRYEKFVEVV